MVEIKVLNDDRCSNSDFCSSHGLSLYVDTGYSKFLFDVGQDDNFKKNAVMLGVNLDNVDFIVLSHGHYDHTDGLKFLDRRYKIYCHPDCTIWRKSKRTLKYNGLPFSKGEFLSKFDVQFSKKPLKIDEITYFLGEIQRKTPFECKSFPSWYKNGKTDTAKDDSGVAIKTEDGLIVISGCGHSGICNTIEWAKAVTGEQKVLAVIGGFHLKEIDEQTIKTVDYFRKNHIQKLFLGHCTSDNVCHFIQEKLGGEMLEAGKVIRF